MSPTIETVPVSPRATMESSIKQEVHPDLWVIHGKSYDLTDFASRHPGGEYILMLGKGRDCTELFESVHALSGLEKPRSILANYEVKGVPLKEDLFSWHSDGFYSVLRQRVQERFKGRNYKASWFILCKIFVLISLYLYCFTQAFLTGNYLWAIASGILTEMVGFCLMHDSSHNAVSKRPLVNYFGLLWSSWTLWNHWLWLQHHCYAHHSYTGVYGKDPDIHNVDFLLRKHTRSKKSVMSHYQHYYNWVFYFLLPNQHLGQAILYQLQPRLNGRVFITPVINPEAHINYHSYIVMTLSCIWHLAIPLYFQPVHVVALIWVLNYTFMGISYFLNVAPNHDTLDTQKNHPEAHAQMDWGEQQVRCTGNHSVGFGLVDRIITHLWGGMNFQIEHHLFPALNHGHYAEVAEIVKATCKEFDIPYNSDNTWKSAMVSYSEFIKRLALFPRGADITQPLKNE